MGVSGNGDGVEGRGNGVGGTAGGVGGTGSGVGGILVFTCNPTLTSEDAMETAKLHTTYNIQHTPKTYLVFVYFIVLCIGIFFNFQER